MKPESAALLAALAAIALACAAFPAPLAAQACTVDRATGTAIDTRQFLRDAAGPQWNAATNQIAFNAKNAQGFYRVYIAKPDGSGARDLTAGMRNMPTKHQGTAYWHPSGRYLLLTVEKQDHRDTRMFGSPDYGAMPGFGMHDDLWAVAADGSRAWQLTNLPDGKYEGILIPIVSPDGSHVAWSERQPDGKYAIKVAEFLESPQPHLANTRTYQPGGPAYYETGSFSSDGKWILYTSDQDTRNFWFSQIYRLNLKTGQSQRLTKGNQYNEHPVAVSTPTGDWVVYMSSLGVTRRPLHVMLGTEWYAMRLDGSANKRLSWLNTLDRRNPQYSPQPLVVVKATPSPSGDGFLGDIEDSLARQSGYVIKMRFSCN